MDLEKVIESFSNEEKNKDYSSTDIGDEKIVFITTCQHRERGSLYDFSDEEWSIVHFLLEKSKIPSGAYQFVPAVRQPNISEDDMTTPLYEEMRPYLNADIEEIDPELIIPLGNVAMKTLLKKSGLFNKRGREFLYEDYPVVPTYGAHAVMLEPKLRKLFVQDLDNAYDKFIRKVNKFEADGYTLCATLEEFTDNMDIADACEVIALDVETTGLDFKKDEISTLAISYEEGKAFVVPLNHRESPFDDSDREEIRKRLSALMENENVEKIFHSCQFDLKFLLSFGIETFNNIGDTKIMHSLIDENLPHALLDLVKEYFPKELEKF